MQQSAMSIWLAQVSVETAQQAGFNDETFLIVLTIMLLLSKVHPCLAGSKVTNTFTICELISKL